MKTYRRPFCTSCSTTDTEKIPIRYARTFKLPAVSIIPFVYIPDYSNHCLSWGEVTILPPMGKVHLYPLCQGLAFDCHGQRCVEMTCLLTRRTRIVDCCLPASPIPAPNIFAGRPPSSCRHSSHYACGTSRRLAISKTLHLPPKPETYQSPWDM